MPWSLTLVTPPANEPLEVSALKGYDRIPGTSEDDDLLAFCAAVRNHTEEYLSRSLITQTWELGLPCFPREDRIRLPRGPVQSVTSVKYTDTAGTERTMAAGTDYLVDIKAELAEIVLPFGHVWPPNVLTTSRPVVVQYVAGYGDTTADIPPLIMLAMKQLASHWSNYRGVVSEQQLAGVPHVYESLLSTFRLRYSGPFKF